MPEIGRRAAIFATFAIAGPPFGFVLMWPTSALFAGHNPIPPLSMSAFLLMPLAIIGSYVIGGIPAIVAGLIVSLCVRPSKSRTSFALSAIIGGFVTATFFIILTRFSTPIYHGHQVAIHSYHTIENMTFVTVLGCAAALTCFLIGSGPFTDRQRR
jgi:uncharacterized membrane protein